MGCGSRAGPAQPPETSQPHRPAHHRHGFAGTAGRRRLGRAGHSCPAQPRPAVHLLLLPVLVLPALLALAVLVLPLKALWAGSSSCRVRARLPWPASVSYPSDALALAVCTYPLARPGSEVTVSDAREGNEFTVPSMVRTSRPGSSLSA